LDYDAYRELKSQQAGGVIDETFSLKNIFDTARKSDTPGDRSGSKPLKTRGATRATPKTVNPTKPKGKRKMLTKLYLKSRQEVVQAAA
jgi:hypothetical protein